MPAAWAMALTANGNSVLSTAAITSGCPTAYPMRMPARPWAFENVRVTTTFGCWGTSSRTGSPYDGSRNSRYASSITTIVLGSTDASSSAISDVRNAVPVGLFGVARSTSLVEGVTAAATASRSKACSDVSGTVTAVPFIRRV